MRHKRISRPTDSTPDMLGSPEHAAMRCLVMSAFAMRAHNLRLRRAKARALARTNSEWHRHAPSAIIGILCRAGGEGKEEEMRRITLQQENRLAAASRSPQDIAQKSPHLIGSPRASQSPEPPWMAAAHGFGATRKVPWDRRRLLRRLSLYDRRSPCRRSPWVAAPQEVDAEHEAATKSTNHSAGPPLGWDLTAPGTRERRGHSGSQLPRRVHIRRQARLPWQCANRSCNGLSGGVRLEHVAVRCRSIRGHRPTCARTRGGKSCWEVGSLRFRQRRPDAALVVKR